MILTKVCGAYGAPMGRRNEGIISDADTLELEWVPFVDGAYDCGGAYWGMPDDLYCAVGYVDGEEVAREYLRAGSRDEAADMLLGLDGAVDLLPENGSLIRQTIAVLQDYQASLTVEEEDIVETVWEEIKDLEQLLTEKGLEP